MIDHIGQICWKLVGELRLAILSESNIRIRNLPVFIDYASPFQTFLSLHSSDSTICSVSTFCFYAGYGARNIYIYSSNKLINFGKHSSRLPNYIVHNANIYNLGQFDYNITAFLQSILR